MVVVVSYPCYITVIHTCNNIIQSYHVQTKTCNEWPLSPSLQYKPDSRSPRNNLPSDAIHIEPWGGEEREGGSGLKIESTVS